MPRPDFGTHRLESNGMVLECRYIVPGLTLHDLTMIFDEAKKQAKPGDEYAGNPSKWPDVRGVTAVTNAILDAIYSSSDKPADVQTPLGTR